MKFNQPIRTLQEHVFAFLLESHKKTIESQTGTFYQSSMLYKCLRLGTEAMINNDNHLN